MLEIKCFTSGFVRRAIYQDEFAGKVIQEKSVGTACSDVAAADDCDASPMRGQGWSPFVSAF
jgi:hypothetical protein